ncbi:MAG TPA: P-loop NTPase fold protein [Solirubrobacterales bacterium]|nr:P-loop NTPase fold protein [Solirubrobacterales bacterium]
MARGEAQSERAGPEHEALISYPTKDKGWATRLQFDLRELGVRSSLYDFDFLQPENLRDILSQPPIPRTLIVLWTPEARGDRKIQIEVDSLASVSQERPGIPILPIFFAPDLAQEAPEPLRKYQSIVLDPLVYAAGVGEEAPESARVQWRQAVHQVAQALLVQAQERVSISSSVIEEEEEEGVEREEEEEEEIEEEEEEPSSAPDLIRPAGRTLRELRVWLVDGGQEGWMLGKDLAVVRAELGLSREVRVATPAGKEVKAVVLRLPAEAPFNRLEGFALLRFKSDLAVAAQLPIGRPVPARPIEIWGESLVHARATGEIGAANPDGSLDLTLSSRGGIEDGSAVWDPAASRLIGIAMYAGLKRWRLLPVETLRDLAARAQPREAAPPSARIHDDGWTTEDCLDYTLYATAISEFIRHPDTKAPLVIGIQGPWGQGKTSLMRLAQDRLDPGHPDLEKRRKQVEAASEGSSELTFGDLRDSLDGDVDLEDPQPAGARTVWFNPWKYQSSEALWAGLANAILSQLPARLSRRKQELFWLQLQARRIDVGAVRRDIHRLVFDRLLPWLVASVFVGLVVAAVCVAIGAAAALTALSSVAVTLGGTAISWLVAHRKAMNSKLEGNYLRYVSQPDYSGKLGYFHYVEEDMRRALDLLAPADEPTVIFIDDLDRCGATRIGEVLEAINLFLSGEYPNCFFVLGIDAQVVASAMETVHRAAIGEGEGESDDAKGHLGWRFLEKFIQLSFVMPRISDEQRAAYLATLLGVKPDWGEGLGSPAEGVSALAAEVLQQVITQDLDPAQASNELGEMRAAAPASESKVVRQVAEAVIAQGAKDFRDTDPETIKALEDQLPHLSDNPRTIKRAVNLYRFYHFISWARDASAPDLESADTELIADWTVIAARWPQAVHWLQVNGRGVEDPQAELLRALEGYEPELVRFLEQKSDLDLKQAMSCGLW